MFKKLNILIALESDLADVEFEYEYYRNYMYNVSEKLISHAFKTKQKNAYLFGTSFKVDGRVKVWKISGTIVIV